MPQSQLAQKRLWAFRFASNLRQVDEIEAEWFPHYFKPSATVQPESYFLASVNWCQSGISFKKSESELDESTQPHENLQPDEDVEVAKGTRGVAFSEQ